METATTAATNSSPNQSSPFAKLPAELRIAIYKFALQATMDSICPETIFGNTGLKIQAEYSGALALLHTSKIIRAESAQQMLPIVQTKLSSWEESYRRTMATCNSGKRHPDPMGFFEDIRNSLLEGMEEVKGKIDILQDVDLMVSRCLRD